MNQEPRIRILVAEDDRALADIIRTSLSRLETDVTVAHDGQKALGLARSQQFDFIVSDYQMPKLDGMQFLRSVREDSLSRHAHLIFCSAKTYELDSEELKKDLSISRVFYKPFSLAELSKAVLELQGHGMPLVHSDAECIEASAANVR